MISAAPAHRGSATSALSAPGADPAPASGWFAQRRTADGSGSPHRCTANEAAASVVRRFLSALRAALSTVPWSPGRTREADTGGLGGWGGRGGHTLRPLRGLMQGRPVQLRAAGPGWGCGGNQGWGRRSPVLRREGVVGKRQRQRQRSAPSVRSTSAPRPATAAATTPHRPRPHPSST